MKITIFRLTRPLIRLWWRFTRGVTLGVRVVAVDEAGRVALVRHTYTRGWHLPGGGVDRGETTLAAAVRELAEETGAQPLAALTLVGVLANFADFPGDHVVLYRGDVRAPGDRAPDSEIADVIWVDPSSAPTDTTPAARRCLDELFNGAPARSEW